MVAAEKPSMANAYSRQCISRSALTPLSLYTSRSMGRRTGSSHVRPPSSTRARYKPTGRTVRSRTTEKMRNCIQPFAVMSELLREEQREDQVRQQDDGEDKGDGSEQVHVY